MHWHPLVSKDYCLPLWLVVLEQRLVRLKRPIRERQSLPRSEQMWSVAGLSPWFRAFLVCLCFSLFGKCIFKLGKALLHCLPPSWTLWSQGFSSVDINDQGPQVLLADIFITIKQPFCYFQQYEFFSLWCDRDSPAFFGKGDQLRCLVSG